MILQFAAHHIEAGADHLFVYLDAACPQAARILRRHPKITVVRCNAEYWASKGSRPKRHQVRQTANAADAYRRAGEMSLDWLAHIDVDEFLHSPVALSTLLAALPGPAKSVRIRPRERLALGNAYKSPVAHGKDKALTEKHVYGANAAALRRGMLSHVAGKLALRIGLDDATLRIHNTVIGGELNLDETELPEVVLLHNHAENWREWHDRFDFRLRQGAYRPDQNPEAQNPQHRALHQIRETGGVEALQRFFAECCTDTPHLRARLSQHGLLHVHDLDLPATCGRVFPSGI